MAEAERKIACLEAFGLDIEPAGILHASGMAAISTLLFSNLKAGDKVKRASKVDLVLGDGKTGYSVSDEELDNMP